MNCLVAGGGGFIGGHLVKSLKERGDSVTVVDIKSMSNWYQPFYGNSNIRNIDNCDLKNQNVYDNIFRGTRYDIIYNLAADMGGMGFIENNKTACMLSVLINTNLLMAAKTFQVKKFLFSSSACVYAHNKQTDSTNPGLKEEDAYPAMAEDGYGWEKLFSERMCNHFYQDHGLEITVPRYHNVFGIDGTYTGGREKAPAAICRKVANAVLTGKHEIEIWGDGEQTRSFMYVDDCIQGIHKLVESNYRQPINLGSSEMVSINQMVTMVEEIAGVKLNRVYKLDAPKGVRGRNSDNTLIKSVLNGWEPSIKLRDGLEKTYKWIYDQLKV
jgi:nucleoside-diphosphate-sugar epimerase